jgi:hypothetical protein
LAVAHFVGSDRFVAVLLGLTPQALCCRLLRRLKAKVLKHKISNILVYRVLSHVDGDPNRVRDYRTWKEEVLNDDEA